MSNILLVIAITIFVIYFFGFVFTILTIFLERKYKKQINKTKISKYSMYYFLQ